ncbi:MAG: transporter substrate-binding domain-containing protein [Candidatus Competibacteraceae bacterium]
MHIIAIALIGTYALQGAITLRPIRLIRFALISVALLAAALLGIHAFYTHVYVESYSKDQLLASLHLIGNPQPHTFYREVPKDKLDKSADPRSFSRIKERGILRACYVPDDYPSAFFNRDGALVGFDVEMAHRFARDLDAAIEFMPIRNLHEASEWVNSDYCDVLMSLQVITPRQTERFAMSSPVLNLPVSLIVLNHRRDEFQEWAGARDMEGLRVAISDEPVAKKYLAKMLPNAAAVAYQNKQEMDRILASGAKDVDAIAAFAQKAAAWTILYPTFTIVTPKPTLFIPAGYAVARDDTDLLLYLDTWLLNAKTNGTIDALYRYWMLGEVKQTQPPRWSVIRDVLHWID